MAKRVIGIISLILAFVGMIETILNVNTDQLVERIIPTIIFTILAVFLLIPKKKTNTNNYTLPAPPPNAQNNPNICAICGKRLGSSYKTLIADGAVCYGCLNRALVSRLDNPQAFNVTSIRAFFNRRIAMVNSFSPTKRAGSFIEVDENHKLFKIGANLFEYNNLFKFELLEDGDAVVTGGLGQAFDDGLFVINRRNLQGVCKSMQLRVTLTNAHICTTCLTLLSLIVSVQRSDGLYQKAQTNAQSCVYLLQKIVEQVESSARAAQAAQARAAQAQAAQKTTQQAASIVDEIENLYQLLHSGLITQEEFDAKKKQLLGL